MDKLILLSQFSNHLCLSSDYCKVVSGLAVSKNLSVSNCLSFDMRSKKPIGFYRNLHFGNKSSISHPRTRKSQLEKSRIYDCEVLRSNSTHFFVHWVGYPSSQNSWIPRDDLVLRHPTSLSPENKFRKSLQQSLKRALTTSRKDDCSGTVVLPVDSGLFQKFAKYGTKAPARRGDSVYRFSNSQLSRFLGSYSDFAFRILNGEGDFAYIEPNTVSVSFRKPRAIVEFVHGVDGFVHGVDPSIYCMCPRDKLHISRCTYEPRTMERMAKYRKLKSKNARKNCIAEPVFWFIKIINHVIDVLHWFIRVSDVLLCLLISELRKEDKKLQIREANEFSREKYRNLSALEDQMQSAGVPLKFSIDIDSKKLVWNSLRATDRRILCKTIDVVALLGDCDCRKAKVLQKCFSIVSSHNESLREQRFWEEEEIVCFENQAQEFIELFVSVFPKKHANTPYIHVYVCHMGDLLREHGSLYPFMQECIEKYNDVNKIMYFRNTNKQKRSGMRQLAQKQNRLMLSRTVVQKYRKRHHKKY